MEAESHETKHNPKAEAWLKAMREVAAIVDRRGEPVDPGIKEAVAALRVIGLSTCGSCEGHMDWGEKAPWVDIGDIPAELKKQWTEAQRKSADVDSKLLRQCEEAKRRVLSEEARVIDLLEEFYRDREVPSWRRLILHCYPDDARLLSQGAGVQDLYPPDIQAQRLQAFREEMALFTTFLKDRFFAG